MKKLTFKEFTEIDLLSEFNRVHKIKVSSWKIILGDEFQNLSKEDHYNKYCAWFELYNSPLGQLMREDE